MYSKQVLFTALRQRSLWLLCLLWLPVGIAAQGDAVFVFLKNASHAQSQMSGGYLPAHTQPAVGATWDNPAMLSGFRPYSLQLNYNFYLADVGGLSALMTMPESSLGAFALGFRRMTYGDFVAADEYGNRTGSFSAFDQSIDLAWSYPLLDSTLRIGASGSYVFAVYEQYRSQALAFSGGLYYRSSNGRLAVGLVLRHAGWQLRPFSDAGYESLPMELNFGVAKKLAHAPFRFLLTWHNLQDLGQSTRIVGGAPTSVGLPARLLRHTNVGLEFVPGRRFYVGLSYNYGRRADLLVSNAGAAAGFGWGMGLRSSYFDVEFSQAAYHKSSGSQLFSLVVHLDKLGHR